MSRSAAARRRAPAPIEDRLALLVDALADCIVALIEHDGVRAEIQRASGWQAAGVSGRLRAAGTGASPQRRRGDADEVVVRARRRR